MSGRRAITHDFLTQIAKRYQAHVQAGRMPAPAIAHEDHVPVRTVHRWVYEARKLGLLPKGTPPGLCGGPVRRPGIGAVGQAVRGNIRRLRDLQHLSVRMLAQRMETTERPLLPSAISKIESGQRRVDVDELAALAASLGVSVAVLLGLDEICGTCGNSPPPGFACPSCDVRLEEAAHGHA